MTKKAFFEKLLAYKQDAIKARTIKGDCRETEYFYDGIVVGLTEAYSILFPDDMVFPKSKIRYKDKEAINFLKARICDFERESNEND
jgi:hypothetical protein